MPSFSTSRQVRRLSLKKVTSKLPVVSEMRTHAMGAPVRVGRCFMPITQPATRTRVAHARALPSNWLLGTTPSPFSRGPYESSACAVTCKPTASAS